MKTTLVRLALSFFMILGLGCSRLEWGLKFADDLALYTLTDYFELSSEQKQQFRDVFKEKLTQLQKQNFTGLADQLDALATSVEKKNLTADLFLKFSKDLENDFRRAIQSFEPLGQQVVNAEAAHGFKTFDAKFISKLSEDEKALAETTEATFKKDMKKAKGLADEAVDYLTDSQKADLEATLKKYPSPEKLQIESRKAVFEKFKKVREDATTRAAFVKDFFMNWEAMQTPAFLTARTVYRKEMEALCMRIYQSMNDEQRASFAKKMRGRAKELRALAAKA